MPLEMGLGARVGEQNSRKKNYISILKKNRSRKKEGVATNYNVCQGLLLALVSPASNAKVQKIFAHMSKTFAWALCFRFLLVFSFFCIICPACCFGQKYSILHGTSGGDAVIDAPFMSISR